MGFLPSYPSAPCNRLRLGGAESIARQEKPLLKWRIRTMLLVTERKNVLERVISSYEVRIQSIEGFFEATGQIFRDFQESLLTRAVWEFFRDSGFSILRSKPVPHTKQPEKLPYNNKEEISTPIASFPDELAENIIYNLIRISTKHGNVKSKYKTYLGA